MRVLLATGIEELDRDLEARLPGAQVSYYREAVVEEAERQNAEVVVLSASLPGSAPLEELVLALRLAGRRVVLLPGARGSDDRLVRRAVALGVYDIVYDPVTAEAVAERVERPGTLADVGKFARDLEEVPVKAGGEEAPRAREPGRAFSFLSRGGKRPARPAGPGEAAEFPYDMSPWAEEEPGGGEEVPAGKERISPGGIRPQGEPGIAVVGSVFSSPGVSRFAASLAGHLAKRDAVAAVDCDLNRPGLAVRFGLRDFGDWRRGDPPVTAGRVAVFPLDPGFAGAPGEAELDRVLEEARRRARWVVVDAGSDPRAWWFARAVREACLVVWVFRQDPVLAVRAAAGWRGRPRAGCREVAVLLGPGDPREVEQSFVVPCFQVLEGDERGLGRVADVLRSSSGRTRRVMVVGVEEVPDVPGVALDVFRTAGEALAWLESNRPDAAVVAPGLEGGELVEYDLRRMGVPVERLVKGRKGGGKKGFFGCL